MRGRGFVVVLLASLVLVGAAPASASVAGPEAKAIWGPVSVNGRSQFPLYHRLRVGIFQTGLAWASVAPTRPRDPRNPRDPAYRWSAQIDYALRQAARYHMRVLLQVSQTPAWANGGRGPTYPPTRARDLANFLTAATRRYPAVHLWMIWGEPNRKPNFAILAPASPSANRLTRAQARAPRVYAQLLDSSYGALKRVSKRNLVIGGNTYTTGDISTRLWIRYMRLPNGRPPRMDLYGHNPFSWRAPNLLNPPSPQHEVDFSDLGRLSRLVDRELASPRRHIKLFLSEWMIPTSPRDSELFIWVDPSVQARWITAGWRIVRRSSFIYGLGWIHVYDGSGSSSGLLYSSGKPKPGFFAFMRG